MSCETINNVERCRFIDLFWEDILFINILPLLSLKELYVLRGLSRKYKLLIDTYFKYMKSIRLGPYSNVFSVEAFQVLTRNCVNLKELSVPRCFWLTDELIAPLFENNIYLTKIVLNQCNGLSSVCLQPVIINCKQLRKLCLSECVWLTVGCLQSITLHQYNLVEVDFTACLLVDKLETLNSFLVISHKIRVLSIAKMSCVNDSTMSVLARSARQLESLNISGCHKVTSYGISLLIEYCPNLQGLLCFGCPQVSLQTIRLPRQRPNLLILPAPPLQIGPRILLPRLNV